MATRIVLADDHALFRQGLRSLLRQQADFEVLDSGVPVALKDFYAGESAISLAVLLDISGSMAVAGNINRAREAVTMAAMNRRNNSDEGARFALSQDKLIDFAYRAMHEMTVQSKTIVGAFYSRPPRLSYYQGCSTGGRQGMMEAQRYPEDFDAIVAKPAGKPGVGLQPAVPMMSPPAAAASPPAGGSFLRGIATPPTLGSTLRTTLLVFAMRASPCSQRIVARTV